MRIGAITVVDGAQLDPPPAHRRHPSLDVDFLAFGIPQDAWSHRHWGALGPPGAARRDGTDRGWRRDDPRRRPPRIHAGHRSPHTSSRRAHPRSPRPSAFGAAVDYLAAIGMDDVRNHDRCRSPATPRGAWQRFPISKIYRPERDSTRRGGAVSFQLADIHRPRHRHHPRPVGQSPCGPGITVPGRC